MKAPDPHRPAKGHAFGDALIREWTVYGATANRSASGAVVADVARAANVASRCGGAYRQVKARYNPAMMSANDTGATIMA
jgi:hypothetical protein